MKLAVASAKAVERAVFACSTSPIVAGDGSSEEIWFALNALVCTVCADAVAVCELATDCNEAAGFESGPSEPTDTAWEALRSALAEAAAVALFDWERPVRTPELTMLRFVGLVWVACAIAWASWEAEICWLMSSAPGATMLGARREKMSGASTELPPIESETDWVALELAAAFAAEETTFDCPTCAVSVPEAVGAEAARPSVVPPAGLEAAGDGPALGAPVHAQFHTQLQSQAWLRAKLAAAPLGPVHVQLQTHRPATGAGADAVGDDVGEEEEAGVEEEPSLELELPEGCGEVWEEIHDQIQLGPAVDASATPVGRTLSVHVQFHVHGSAPVGT